MKSCEKCVFLEKNSRSLECALTRVKGCDPEYKESKAVATDGDCFYAVLEILKPKEFYCSEFKEKNK